MNRMSVPCTNWAADYKSSIFEVHHSAFNISQSLEALLTDRNPIDHARQDPLLIVLLGLVQVRIQLRPSI